MVDFTGDFSTCDIDGGEVDAPVYSRSKVEGFQDICLFLNRSLALGGIFRGVEPVKIEDSSGPLEECIR